MEPVIIEKDSGVVIEIRPTGFKNAIRLKNAIMREIADHGIDLKPGVKFQEMDVSEVISQVASIDCSEAVQRGLFACLDQSKYGGLKITENTFDNMEARECYYEIMIACIKVNIVPFFKGLPSLLSQIMPPKG